MFVRVTCSGVVVGSADFEPPFGLAHARLEPGPGYQLAAPAAQEVGRQLSRSQFWPPSAGDFADQIASQWSGPRLALVDETGCELSVNGIVLVEDPRMGRRVVADFRPDLARAEAFLRTLGPGGVHRRPAA